MQMNWDVLGQLVVISFVAHVVAFCWDDILLIGDCSIKTIESAIDLGGTKKSEFLQD